MRQRVLRSNRGKALVRWFTHEAILGASYLVLQEPISSTALRRRVAKGWRGDAEALRSDWKRVGDDLRVALGKFEARRKP